MKSLLLREYLQLEITDLPTPQPQPDEVLVRVAACGICGSDVHGYDGSTGRRIPPLVMGHEASGEIAAIGADVTLFKPGDRVTFDSTIYCGHCDYCLRGQVNLCDNREIIGVSPGNFRRHGAFAEYLAVPERVVYHLPDQMTFPEAAMLEAVSVALHAVRISGPLEGKTALVVGAGMIGLLTLQAARAAGCSKVFVSDVEPSRLDLARQLGADQTFCMSGEELVRIVYQHTGSAGVDIALEAVGRDETVATAIDSVRKGGSVTLIGNVSPEVTLPLQKVVSREIRLQGSASSSGEYPQAIDLIIRGAIQVKPLITAVAPLEDGPEWFRRLYKREPFLMKVVLAPQWPLI